MKEFTAVEMYEFIVNKSIPDHINQIDNGTSIRKLSSLGSLSPRYRQYATLAWHLHEDAKKFKECMKIATEYEHRWFVSTLPQRPNNKYDTPCQLVFDALNTGDWNFACDYIQYLDDHHDYDTKPTNHSANWLYRCLASLALNRYEDQWSVFIDKLKKGYSTKKYGKLYPLALMLESIWNNDEKVFNDQAHIFAASYKSMTRGIFPDYEDKLLSLWGLGICNLAVMKGLKVTIDRQYLPKELIG
jgi:hypothetical protein